MKVQPFNYSKNPLIGIYQDKIEHIDTGKIEYRIGHNDVSDYFGKIISMELQRSNMVDTSNFNTAFNGTDSITFYDNIQQIFAGTTDTHFQGIHSWEVGEGNTQWDSTPLDLNNDTVDDVTGYNEYGYPVNGTNDVSQFMFFDQKTQNSLYQTVNSKQSFRKQVDIQFQIPSHYVDSQNSIDTTDTQTIITNLKNGTYTIDKVVEWTPTNSINDFLMVQSIFDTTEQNFSWREFAIFGGNLKDGNSTIVSPDQTQDTDYQKLTSDYGTLLDYKVHNVITKTQNMRITRRIIFGFYQISH